MSAVPAIAGPSESESQSRVRAALERGFGFIWPLASDPDVIEIMLNDDGRVWTERLSTGVMEPIGTLSASQAEQAITLVAASLNTTITRADPILECELPHNGSRFEAVIPPVVQAPTFSIRRKASKVYTLADYESAGILSADQRRAIEGMVAARKNLVIAGSTSSGKTTFANGVLNFIATTFPLHRVLVMEDTLELQVTSPNRVMMRSTDAVDMTRLVRVMMRLRPDRVIAGEVRDAAAFALLKMWNTGHPGGLATLHCDSALDALTRLESLCAEAPTAPPAEYLRTLIGRAVGGIVFLERSPEGRRVREVLTVSGYRDGAYVTQPAS